ncbi:MAG: hypothetical protein WAZ21_00285 [Candidatus Saccharimonadales bacterium]
MKDPGWRPNRAGISWKWSNPDDAKSGNWFGANALSDDGRNDIVGFYMRDALGDIGDDGQMNCSSNNNQLLKKALGHWGISGIDITCESQLLVRENGTDCKSGNGNFKMSDSDNTKVVDKFRDYIVGKVYGGRSPQLTDAMQFVLHKRTLLMGCAYGAQAQTAKPSGANVYEVAKVYKGPAADFVGPPSQTQLNQINITSEYYIGNKSPDTGDRWLWTNPNNAKTCQQLADAVKPGASYATAYKNWVSQNNINPTSISDTGSSSQQPGAANTARSCDIGSLGWIICPAMSFLGDVTDKIYTIVIGLLETKISIFETLDPTKNSTYVAWGVMRNIANIAFVIVFLIIIYSQLTSMGVSNYGIKKMLPKLIVAAILVNLSFYICQIAVDLSNILGGSIKNFFDGIGGLTATNSPGGTDMSSNAGGIIALVTLAIAGGIVLIATLLPILAVGVVAILMIFLLLLFRQAAIIILIFVAPLAFVAFLLPNTQKFFDQWRKMFTAMLVLYPIIALVFGAAGLASTVIKQSAASNASQSDLDLLAVVALGVALIPLFVVPTLLKGALSSLGAIGAKINSIGTKAEGSARAKGQKAYDNSRVGQFNKYREGERVKRRGLIQAGVYSGRGGKFNPRNWASAANNSFNQSNLSGNFGDRSAAMGVDAAEKIEDEQVGAAAKLMSFGTDPSEMIGKAGNELTAAINSGDIVKARAAQKILLNSGNKGVQHLQQTLESSMNTVEGKKSDVGRNLRADLNAAGLKGKNNVLSTWANNTDTISNTATDRGTFEALNDVELAGQSLDNLTRGRASITYDQAKSIQENSNVFKDLDPKKKALFAQIAPLTPAGTTPPVAPPGAGAPPVPPVTPPTPPVPPTP